MNKIYLNSGDYYTQRNNKYKPYEACMPTSWVMWAIAEGFKAEIQQFCLLKNLDINTFDNYCMEFLNTSDARSFCDKKYTWATKIPPNQVHGMYHSYLEPHILGRIVSDFKPESMTYSDVISLLEKGHSCWTSGAFDGVNGPIDGHAFAIVGIYNNVIRLADPYGNFKSKYRNSKGYDVMMTRMDFEQHAKPLDRVSKNMHILRE